MSSSHSQWSKRSLTAQAMGHVDPITKGRGDADPRVDDLYPRRGQRLFVRLRLWPARQRHHPRGRGRTRRCWRRRRPARCCSRPAWRRPPPCSRRSIPAITWWPPRSCTGPCGSWLLTEADALGPRRWNSSRPTTSMPCARPSCRAGPSWSGSRRPRTRSGPSPTSRAQPRSPTRPARGWRSIRPPPRPIHTRPLALGADIVMHAATKVLNGHSDVVAGVLAGAKADAFWARIVTIRKVQGAILGPFEAYLLMRGMRTLHVRAAAQAKSAHAISPSVSPLIRRSPACSIRPAAASRPRHRGAADGKRIRLHAVDSGLGRRGGRDPHGGAGGTVETRDLARRRREPDRASGLDRRAGNALPAGPLAPVHGHRGSGGPLRRSRRRRSAQST